MAVSGAGPNPTGVPAAPPIWPSIKIPRVSKLTSPAELQEQKIELFGRRWWGKRIISTARASISAICALRNPNGSHYGDSGGGDHSRLTRIRQRRGEERFRTIFWRTVRACPGGALSCGPGLIDGSPTPVLCL